MKPRIDVVISVPAKEVALVKHEVEKYADTVTIKVVIHYSPKETQGRILLRLDFEQLGSLAQWLSTALLALGSKSEKINDYEQALKYYLKGLEYNPIPKDLDTAYFLYNNAGSCFNILRDYSMGVIYCRKAVEINPTRHNAYENLGISMEGMGNYIEAARNYITATKKLPEDERAFTHLKSLLLKRPRMTDEFPELREALSECQVLQAKKR